MYLTDQSEADGAIRVCGPGGRVGTVKVMLLYMPIKHYMFQNYIFPCYNFQLYN